MQSKHLWDKRLSDHAEASTWSVVGGSSEPSAVVMFVIVSLHRMSWYYAEDPVDG